MLAVLRRLSLARLLAVLAILVMTGLGQHVHASEVPGDAGVTLTVDAGATGQHGGKAIAPDAHCGTCHLVRATTPDASEAREPASLRLAHQPLDGALQPDLARPDGPTRPPRRVHAV